MVGLASVSPPGSAEASAAQWPWGRAPDQVTATCSIEPAEVEQGASTRLRAQVDATDTRKHALAYVWSGNGGHIMGSGPSVEVDASRLNPGSYALSAVARDAYKNHANCIALFRVVAPPEPLGARCTGEPAEMTIGEAAQFQVQATGGVVGSLRYEWFTNGGVIVPEGAAARLETAGLEPREYTVTARVEDGAGRASDCMASVKLIPPPPPAPPPELLNLAQIPFPGNSAMLGANERFQLDKVIQRTKEDSGGRLSIESYAGPDERNPQALAGERAAAVKRHLMDGGVSESRITVQVGLGGRLGGSRNRTVDVIWVPDGMEY
jgi:outer membrane protein OmpA-like peptidoglycan-associated protein